MPGHDSVSVVCSYNVFSSFFFLHYRAVFSTYVTVRFCQTSSNVGGTRNTFIGRYAGYTNIEGVKNTFLGYSAGYLNTASYNVFLGYNAGHFNTTGAYNTFLGHLAGYNNTIGYRNTIIGNEAGISNTEGYGNNFIGNYAGLTNTTGYYNTFQGNSAGYYNTTGSQNAFFGTLAGRNNVQGHANTLIGYGAGYSVEGSGNVCLGYQAGFNETGSNKLYIDNTNTATPLIYGDFAANTITINGTLTGELVDTSSREYKDNIQALKIEDAMATLQGLNPVTFTFKRSPQEQKVGFIAEDVPELVATNDRKGLSSMDVVAVLTKVVQEQQRTIAGLQTELNELKGKIK